MSDNNTTKTLNQDTAGLGVGYNGVANKLELDTPIVMPEPLEQYAHRKNVEAIVNESKAELFAETKLNSAKQRRKSLKTLVTQKYQVLQTPQSNAFQQKIESEYATQNLQEIDRLQSENKIVIPQSIDVIKVQDEVNDAIDMVSATSGIVSADDLEVTVTNSGGEPRLKFSVKRQQIPSDFVLVSKMVKKFNSSIKSRVLDVRMIASVNKNYSIKDKKERLSACSVSYKPESGVVNKGTRVIISKAEDWDISKNFVFFMQESRSKWIGIIDSKKFATREDYMIFISNAISDFYTLGFEVMQERMMVEKKGLRGLARVAETIMKSGAFNCKLKKDGDEVAMIEIVTKGSKNQWLHVFIMPGTYKDTFELNLMSSADSEWVSTVDLGSNLTINWLLDNLIEKLKTWYAMEWDADINLQANKDKYMFDKFNRVKTRMAFNSIVQARNEYPYIGITITKALSVKETNEIMPGNYGAEVIIGKTDKLDYFILAQLGYLIPGAHSKAIGKDGLPTSNRLFIFQLEYSINGTKCIYRSAEFDDVAKETGFLTETPINASDKSKY